MRFSDIIAYKNLLLAWHRLNTATNHGYKRFSRPLLVAYQLGHEANLRRLHQRLRGKWEPSSPQRIYVPKPSGLQRPLSLLALEDQIVLQALANSFARHIAARRATVEWRQVFSNLLNRGPGEQFFLRDWQHTYFGFQEACRKHFDSGHQWVASFDLAAFYDTISHERLVRLLAPRSWAEPEFAPVHRWLGAWSVPDGTSPLGHGIPQGPIASDFLAEAFLLPIDVALSKDKIRFVRYVDDIRVFARSKQEALRAIVKLEVHCKNAGLIPQGKKFLVHKAETLAEALGSLPSLSPPEGPDDDKRTGVSVLDVPDLLRKAIRGKPTRVADKSTLRFLLFRAPRSRRLLGVALRLLGRYPEHVDAIASYLAIYGQRKAIARHCSSLLRSDVPYDYVRAELWLLLGQSASPKALKTMVVRARRDVGTASSAFWLRQAAMTFLLRAERAGVATSLARFRSLSAFSRTLLIPELPDSAFKDLPLIQSLLRQDPYPAGQMLGQSLVARGISLRALGVRTKDLPTETQHTFRALGLVKRTRLSDVDPIGDILSNRFAIDASGPWKAVLGIDYDHALQLLSNADAHYDAGRSIWLQSLNSFNDLATHNVIRGLAEKGLPGAAKVIGSDGKRVKFGTLLQANAPFDKAHPSIASGLRASNNRRNTLPSSHPYDEKSGTRSRFLSRVEQIALFQELAIAYSDLPNVLRALD